MQCYFFFKLLFPVFYYRSIERCRRLDKFNFIEITKHLTCSSTIRLISAWCHKFHGRLRFMPISNYCMWGEDFYETSIQFQQNAQKTLKISYAKRKKNFWILTKNRNSIIWWHIICNKKHFSEKPIVTMLTN